MGDGAGGEGGFGLERGVAAECVRGGGGKPSLGSSKGELGVSHGSGLSGVWGATAVAADDLGWGVAASEALEPQTMATSCGAKPRQTSLDGLGAQARWPNLAWLSLNQ